MTAQPAKLALGRAYHVYNKGVEGISLFKDEADYKTFQTFLREYLSPEVDNDSLKKTFKVNGREFTGVPHKPKNYFNRIELLAYSLKPDHFHLILLEKEPDALKGFMRSLSTRYPVYFNTKYERKGSLFAGPYKSAQLPSEPILLLMTRHLHRGSIYSSYQDYLVRQTSWVKVSKVLAIFEVAQSDYFKNVKSYDRFVEKFSLTPKGEEMLERFTFESGEICADQTQEPSKQAGPTTLPETSSTKITDAHSNPTKTTVAKQFSRGQHLLLHAAVLTALFISGLSNIKGTQAQKVSPAEPIVAGTTTEVSPEPSAPPISQEISEPTEIELPGNLKIVYVVQVAEEFASIPVYGEPKQSSVEVGSVKGDSYLTHLESLDGWYKVLLSNGEIGFVDVRYITEIDLN